MTYYVSLSLSFNFFSNSKVGIEFKQVSLLDHVFSCDSIEFGLVKLIVVSEHMKKRLQ